MEISLLSRNHKGITIKTEIFCRKKQHYQNLTAGDHTGGGYVYYQGSAYLASVCGALALSPSATAAPESD